MTSSHIVTDPSYWIKMLHLFLCFRLCKISSIFKKRQVQNVFSRTCENWKHMSDFFFVTDSVIYKMSFSIVLNFFTKRRRTETPIIQYGSKTSFHSSHMLLFEFDNKVYNYNTLEQNFFCLTRIIQNLDQNWL